MITLIDRESVFRVKPEYMNEKVKRDSETGTIAGRSYAKGWNACLKMWHEEIEKIPLVERTRGTWLPIIETNEFGEPYQAGVYCSRCGHATVYETSFCPHCGVIMDGNPTVDIYIGNCSEIPNDSDTISRQAAIDALWKALHEYEDKTEKQFQESEDLDIGDWILHRIFVQNMSDIDRQTILNLPSAQPEADLQLTCNQLAIERYEDLCEYFGDREDPILTDRREFKRWLDRVRWHVKKVDELVRRSAVQPEIILCKDCAWSMTGDFSKKFFCSRTGALAWIEPNSFCSYAERKTNGFD